MRYLFILCLIVGCGSKTPELGEHKGNICLCTSTGQCDSGCEIDYGDHPPYYDYYYTPPSDDPYWSETLPGGYQWAHDCSLYVSCCENGESVEQIQADYTTTWVECAPSDYGHFCGQAAECACGDSCSDLVWNPNVAGYDCFHHWYCG